MAGFQLSYLAVLGILFFQPRFTNILIIKNSLLDNAWKLFTVSFAAQLITFPLCLYYFHQFPNYFWLTNIVVIPVVWVIMVITILFFCALPFGPLAEVVSTCLDWSLKLMNFLVDYITKLPYAVITNIKFELYHLALFSSFVFLMCFLEYTGKKKYLIPLTELVVLLLLVFEITTYSINDKRQEIVIYRTDYGPAISLISGHKHLLLADTSITNNPAEFERSTRYYWKSRQIDKSPEQIILNTLEPGTSIRDVNIAIRQKKEGLYIDFNRKRFFLLNNEIINIVDVKEKSISDYIIVNASSGYPNNAIMQECKPSVIVIVGRVSYGICRAWNNFATKNNIGFYDINQAGALHLKL
jgi:competence protein ComEC